MYEMSFFEKLLSIIVSVFELFKKIFEFFKNKGNKETVNQPNINISGNNGSNIKVVNNLFPNWGWVVVFLIVIVVVVVAIILLLVHFSPTVLNLNFIHDTKISEAPTYESTATPLPKNGASSVGTYLFSVEYNDDGQIISATEEYGDGTRQNWEYVYDDAGQFQYRKCNIGNVNSTLTYNFLPEPDYDTTYSELDYTIKNCIGFTIVYEVTALRSGNCSGTRKVLVRADGKWEQVGTFDYGSKGDVEEKQVVFTDGIKNIDAFGTPRVNRDTSSFTPEQSLRDVMIADYEYVYIISG